MPHIQIFVDAKNTADIDRILANVSLELRQRIISALVHEAMLIAEEARANAPKKTGALAASIVSIPTIDGAKIVSGVPYASYQEFGTKYIQPKLFLTDALRAHREALSAKITQIIENYFQELKR